MVYGILDLCPRCACQISISNLIYNLTFNCKPHVIGDSHPETRVRYDCICPICDGEIKLFMDLNPTGFTLCKEGEEEEALLHMKPIPFLYWGTEEICSPGGAGCEPQPPGEPCM